jgi:hypothetical protein
LACACDGCWRRRTGPHQRRDDGRAAYAGAQSSLSLGSEIQCDPTPRWRRGLPGAANSDGMLSRSIRVGRGSADGVVLAGCPGVRGSECAGLCALLRSRSRRGGGVFRGRGGMGMDSRRDRGGRVAWGSVRDEVGARAPAGGGNVGGCGVDRALGAVGDPRAAWTDRCRRSAICSAG